MRRQRKCIEHCIQIGFETLPGQQRFPGPQLAVDLDPAAVERTAQFQVQVVILPMRLIEMIDLEVQRSVTIDALETQTQVVDIDRSEKDARSRLDIFIGL